MRSHQSAQVSLGFTVTENQSKTFFATVHFHPSLLLDEC